MADVIKSVFIQEDRRFRAAVARLRQLLSVLPICIGLFFLGAAQAEEGFFSDLKQAPPAVTGAWDATFAVIYATSTYFHYGSAFLIKKQINADGLVLVFMTVAHNIEKCAVMDDVCPHLMMVQNARMKEDSNEIRFDTLNGLRFDEVAVYKVPSSDLAVLAVRMKRQDPSPEPLKLAAECSSEPGAPLFAVGYPGTDSRTSPGHRPIENADVIVKRWSRGIDLGNFKFTDSDRIFLGATVDNVEGLSGGPILNADGRVVSVVQRASGQSGHAYVGNEYLSHPEFQTLGPSCQVLKNIGANLGD